MKIEGEAVYVDAAGKRHSIEGIGSLPDGTALQDLNVSGSFSFGKISCDKIKFSGEICGKSLVAKNISGEGSLEVDAVEVEKTFRFSGGVEIKNLIADEIIIESRGGLIGDVHCGKLKIFHGDVHEIGETILSQIFGTKVSHKSNSRVHIKNIEADTVKLENCAVDVIKCRDAFIGTNCAIEKLFVAGECTVADDSTVGETIRTKSDS